MLNQPFNYTNSKGKTYILHSRLTTLRNGVKQMLYYFAKEAKPNALTSIPAGYEVAETKSGLPVLRKMESAVAT